MMMKYIFTVTLLLILQFFLDSCATEANPSKKNKETGKKTAIIDIKDMKSRCICPEIWMPVCGEDKKTYSNSCSADCAKVKFTNGECQATH